MKEIGIFCIVIFAVFAIAVAMTSIDMAIRNEEKVYRLSSEVENLKTQLAFHQKNCISAAKSYAAAQNLEVIYETSDLEELVKTKDDWFKMSNDDRHRSDMISKWLYGCGNISHYNAMLESMKKCNTKEK